VDYTPHRKQWGIWTAIAMTLIQFTQIFTIQETWLAMSILQVFAVIFYQVQSMIAYAYEPEIGREVGQEAMGRYTAHYTSNQFGAQVVFLLVIVALQVAGIANSAVRTGQISQAINTVTCIVFFGLCWFKHMTPRPALRDLPPNTSIVTAGLKQNIETFKNMNRYFRRGLKWYFLAVLFARAAGSSITNLSVIYLQDTLKLGPMSIAIFFLCTMLGVLPGPHIGLCITRRWDPCVSYKWSCMGLFLVLILGVFILEYLPGFCAYIWGFCLGIFMGWFYGVENLFYSMAMPKGQEAELSGFFVCSTQLLLWLPPLLFVIVIENNIAQKYGWLPVAAFLLIAAGLLSMTGTWEEIVNEAREGLDAIEADKHMIANVGATEVKGGKDAEKAA
jgi:MFS-type transporter involved in bile tolerance (Atg22 family)